MSWDELCTQITRQTGCIPFSGVGIGIRKSEKLAILRSVDNTSYYADDLSDMDHPVYTLFGHNGDQSKEEIRYNEPLLNPAKTEHIYLYRVLTKRKNKKREYVWYGKYEIDDIQPKQHPGKDLVLRTIYLVTLKRIKRNV